MFNPQSGMSHIDYNRLLPVVSTPLSKSYSPLEQSKLNTSKQKEELELDLQDLNSNSVAKVGTIETPPFAKKLIINSHQKEVLYGILLGDASLATENGGRTYRLRLVQSKSHEDYFNHLIFQFQKFGKTAPKINPANNTYYWNSLQSDSFRFYGQEFYQQVDGCGSTNYPSNPTKFQKKVPNNVKRWLTPRAVAYWFLDDGSAKDKKTTTAIRFCTDSFSRCDVDRLAEGLEENFDIKTSVYENRPNQYRIYCKAPSVASFWDQVFPILQNEIASTAPNILSKLPNKIYNKLTLD